MVKKAFGVAVFGITLFFITLSGLGQPDAGQGESGDVLKFLSDFEACVNKIDTYKCVMITDSWKYRKHEQKTLMLYFKRPQLMRIDVLEGDKKGSSIVLNKIGKIRGRNSWGFIVNLSFEDKRLRDIRGYTFLQSSVMDKLRRLKELIIDMKLNAVLTEEKTAGRPAYKLHMDVNGKDPSDPITYEDIWFDKKNYMFLKDLKYEDKNIVSRTVWRDFKINITLDDSIFNL